MEDFRLDDSEAEIAATVDGTGPPILLLHGFPQTRLMWREVASRLAEDHTVVCADLRGYGASGTPPTTADHAPYSKRVMAADMVALMGALGFERFAVVGHDRGARVAYRLALDHPDRVERLGVLDVVPIDTAWDLADDRLALGFWPWSLLAQAAPLPERLIGAAPEAVIDAALKGGWGTPAETFDDATCAAYAEQLRDPAHLHAICEEYRAAAGIDREHDAADRASGEMIECPLLVLWSASGPLSEWYADQGGPLAVWRQLGARVHGNAVEGGHFFPEEHPEATATAIRELLG